MTTNPEIILVVESVVHADNVGNTATLTEDVDFDAEILQFLIVHYGNLLQSGVHIGSSGFGLRKVKVQTLDYRWRWQKKEKKIQINII